MYHGRLTAAQNAERWAILEQPTQTGDCAHVEGISLDMIDKLIAAGFMDPAQTQNDSPTVAEFREFMAEADNADVRAHGYVISPDRDDARVSIEGLEYHGRADDDLMFDFISAFHHADEFGLRCWWD